MPNRILKLKRAWYTACRWQERSDHKSKLGTYQVKKGGEEKVNCGKLRRGKEKG
jgi:hypothetical protein